MVECTGFENQQARKGLEGSNPSLSAGNKKRSFWEGVENLEYMERSNASTIRKVYSSCKEKISSLSALD